MAKPSIEEMRKRLADLQNEVTKKTSEKVSSRKTAKGQRAAKENKQVEFVSARSVHNNGCVDGIIVGEFTTFDAALGESVTFTDYSLGLCPMCFPPLVEGEVQGWSTPVEASIWVKSLYGGKPVTTKAMNRVDNFMLDHESAMESGRAHDAYKRYVHDKFGETITFGPSGAFEKIVNRQIARERAGFANLGLLGYSAADIADLAVHYAWVKRVCRFVEQIGGDKESVAILSRALRDRRSDSELFADAQLGTHKRIVFGTDGRLRHQDNLEKVVLARKYLIARRLFKASSVSQYASAFLPSAGDVYREIGAVIYEGLRQFNNSLEGLTYEGVVTDAIFFNGSKSTSLSTVESELFDEFVYDEVALRRTAVLDTLLTMQGEMTPAEASALIFLECLSNGMPLTDIQSVFECTDRKFNQIARDAETIVSLAPASKVEARLTALKLDALRA